MNYAGKFDGAISSEGPGSHSHFVHLNPGHVHAPADAIVVPDGHFLFNADFKRSGVDLVLSKDDHELVLHDYFKGEKHKALSAPDGAHLTGALVDALTGHVEIAQAGGAQAAANAVIGHVTKLAGSATVMRNGVSIILNNGDNVEKGDVVQTGSSSTVGITFIDGTVFGLSSNARMVLNEMVYDPNGSNNSSLMSLVAGTITFVAGETAKHGDMKIDTPVATMGIRGTAVLVEIDFSSANASFQVLVEPDGTTGSYILFDKATMQPLAIVNQAGQQININNGIISQTQNPLTPQMQQLINEVFSQKFTDNSTTKTTSPTGSSFTENGTTVTLKFADNSPTQSNTQGNEGPKDKAPPPGNGPGGTGPTHIPNTLALTLLGPSGPQSTFSQNEILLHTDDGAPDAVGGVFQFTDINPGDQPVVTTAFSSVTYTNAAHASFVVGAGQGTPTPGLSQLQFADIMATAVDLKLTPADTNANNGKVGWIYEVQDKQFDFLADGKSLSFIYKVTVTAIYNGVPETVTLDLTVVVHGTNDQPIITTDHDIQLIEFAAGTSTPGGTLISLHNDATDGTYELKDPDLTDTHWIVDPNKDPNFNPNANPADPDHLKAIHKAVLTSASMAGPNGTLDMADLQALAPGPMSVFAQALDVDVTTDSTGTGHGTITWQLENLPVFLADFIPAGETLKLFFTIDVTDEHGSTDTKTIEVDITGTNAAATVWIHTTTDGNDSNWTTGANWGTGKAPTSIDDVIIVTDQLHPNTPAYPATITTGTNAAAHSVVMNDFVASPTENIPPELKIESGASLTIGTALDMSANSILTNAGTINIGTQLELLDDATNPVTPVNKSVITNSGTINIGQGGDIEGVASVTNSGTIDLEGGTLNLKVGITNSNGGQGGDVIVESGAKLVLGADSNPGAGTHGGVTGGTVTVNGGGELDLTGGNTLGSGTLANGGQINVSGTGNELLDETVTNTGKIDITGALLIDPSSIDDTGGGSITVESSGILELASATINGGTLTNAGTLDSTATSGIHGATIGNSGTLESTGGTLTIDTVAAKTLTNTGTVKADGSTAELDITTESVDNSSATSLLEAINSGTLKLTSTTVTNTAGTVSDTSGAEIDLSGATINGGTLTNAGTLDSTATSGIHGATIGNSGTLESTGGTLTIDTVAAKTLTNTGTVKADGSTAELDITTESVDNSSATSLLEAINNGTLKLTSTTVTNTAGTVSDTSGAEIDLSGATINGGTLTNAGTLDSTATSGIHGATIGNSGTLESTGGTLTIDTVAAKTLTNTGTVKADGSTAELDITTESVDNSSATSLLEAINSGTLKLTSTTVTNTAGTVSDTSGAEIDLSGATINGGTLTNAGTLDSTATSGIHGATIGNSGTLESTGGTLTIDTVAAKTLTNTGTVKADGATAELDITTESVDNSSATSLLEAINNGTLKLTSTTVTNTAGTVSDTSGAEIDLSGATINGGTLTNAGTLDSTATSGIHGATIGNSGTLESTGGTLTIDTVAAKTLTNTGTVKADGATAELDITTKLVDNSSATSLLEAINSGTLKLTSTTVTNTAGTVSDTSGAEIDLSGATINGGTLTNAGTLNSTATSGIHGATIGNSGTLESTGGTLTIDTVAAKTLTNTGTVKADGATAELDITTRVGRQLERHQPFGGDQQRHPEADLDDGDQHRRDGVGHLGCGDRPLRRHHQRRHAHQRRYAGLDGDQRHPWGHDRQQRDAGIDRRDADDRHGCGEDADQHRDGEGGRVHRRARHHHGVGRQLERHQPFGGDQQRHLEADLDDGDQHRRDGVGHLGTCGARSVRAPPSAAAC